MTHTKGEWFVSSSTLVVTEQVKIIANAHPFDQPKELTIPLEEAMANARLIAAAPIGHELAQAVLAQSKDGLDRAEHINKLAAQFMAKAEGE